MPACELQPRAPELRDACVATCEISSPVDRLTSQWHEPFVRFLRGRIKMIKTLSSHIFEPFCALKR